MERRHPIIVVDVVCLRPVNQSEFGQTDAAGQNQVLATQGLDKPDGRTHPL
jgi:hypothetical protein